MFTALSASALEIFSPENATNKPLRNIGWIKKTHCETFKNLSEDSSEVSAFNFALGLGSTSRLQLRRNGEALLQDRDFQIAEGDSTLIFASPLKNSDTLCLDIYTTPLFPENPYRLNRLERVPIYREGIDSAWQNTVAFTEDETSKGPYHLDYGGSKSLSVAVGNGGGVALDQSLLLDVRGQIAENVFVEGHLSDQNIPIQPEGNTASLKEVDAIFIKVYGQQYGYTLGNYLLDFGSAGTDQYIAKVEGVQGAWTHGDYRVHGSLSVSKGQYFSDTFHGVNGQQRGYYLHGNGGRTFITVLAGTEKVWRNGILLRRGSDYTIEYGEGKLDFLNNLTVTSENIFAVEYQYTEQEYPRSLWSAEVADTAGAWTWSLRSIYEKEDRKSPLNTIYTEDQKIRFSNLGDSTLPKDSLYSRVQLPQDLGHAVAEMNYQKDRHHSHLIFKGSTWDKNLYSSRDDKDNYGYGLNYLGGQAWGQPFNQGGFGATSLEMNHENRSVNYTSFRQLIEPRQFLDTWNLPASIGERDFQADRFTVEEKLFSPFAVGAEYGYAEGHSFVSMNSEREKIYTRLGNEAQYVLLESEAKYARTPLRQDNYRQNIVSSLAFTRITPALRYTRNEWQNDIDNNGLAGKTLSSKEEAELTFKSIPFWNRLSVTGGINGLWQKSNFNNAIATPTDSVGAYGFSQKIDLAGWGPWFSDIFYGYRRFQEWVPNANGRPSIDPTLHAFNQLEWNNRLYDGHWGYNLAMNYRINQTAELPLIQAYDSVAQGRGHYVRDSIGNAFHEDEINGNFILAGLKRDTTLGLRPYQDLGFTLSLDLIPAQFPFTVKGVLADIRLHGELAVEQQDSGGNPNFYPVFTDQNIRLLRSGKSRYAPSLQWKSGSGLKNAELSVERSFAKAAGENASEEKVWNERLHYRQEWLTTWEYSLEQAYENRFREGLPSGINGGSPSTEENENYLYGGSLLKKLPKAFSVEQFLQYENSQGKLSNSAFSTKLQGLKPRFRIEKASLYNGRAYIEYGLFYYWGQGDGGYYTTGGYQRGTTHRVEANAHFQIGQNVYLSINYLIRKEPRSDALIQKLSAEIRAVF